MHGYNRTLRSELGVGGKQTHRDVNDPTAPGGTRREPVTTETVIGASDEARVLDQPDAPVHPVFIEDHVPAESCYASVYDKAKVTDENRQGLVGNTHALGTVRAEVDVHSHGSVVLVVHTDPDLQGNHVHTTLSLTPAQAVELGRRLSVGGSVSLHPTEVLRTIR